MSTATPSPAPRFARIAGRWRLVLVTFVTAKVLATVLGGITAMGFANILSTIEGDQYLNGFISLGGILDDFNVVNMWFRWDSVHYANLAGLDYLRPLSPGEQQLIIHAAAGDRFSVPASLHRFSFPPLFPLLTRALMPLLGGHAPLAMLVIANLACIGCLWYVGALARLAFGDESAGRRAVVYLALFPGAFLLQAALTESLFLCLVLATFYYASANRWVMAAVTGLLAGLARSNGFILALPLALIAAHQARYRLNLDAVHGYLTKLPSVVAPGIGWGLFLLYCKAMTGDPLAYSHLQQAGWGITIQSPLAPFGSAFGDAKFDMVDVKAIFVILVVVLLLMSLRVLPVAYCVCGLAMIAIPLSIGTPWAQSILRYAVVEFPIVLLAVYAARRWPRSEVTLVSIMVSLQTVMLVLWTLPYTGAIV